MTRAESEALLRSVEELRGEVAAVREDADRLRRLPDPIAKALVERSFYRVLMPRELGRLGADPVTHLKMVEAFSAMDGSVGWNFAIGSGTGLLAGFVRPAAPRASSTAATA
ncbi:MAG: acyl-CoA dehydrogenase family protein [Myxococcota bacterium]